MEKKNAIIVFVWLNSTGAGFQLLWLFLHISLNWLCYHTPRNPQKNIIFVLKHCHHDFSNRSLSFEILARPVLMVPLHQLSLGHRVVMCDPSFIVCDYVRQKTLPCYHSASEFLYRWLSEHLCAHLSKFFRPTSCKPCCGLLLYYGFCSRISYSCCIAEFSYCEAVHFDTKFTTTAVCYLDQDVTCALKRMDTFLWRRHGRSILQTWEKHFKRAFEEEEDVLCEPQEVLYYTVVRRSGSQAKKK